MNLTTQDISILNKVCERDAVTVLENNPSLENILPVLKIINQKKSQLITSMEDWDIVSGLFFRLCDVIFQNTYEVKYA
jgi:hypothetical protein